ncbi:MAG: hypothetical protein M3032_08570 [Verrucomicrobiota bacterium]|nr:hypothetical protein [Verrucomicrobiota bacterium]
MKTNTDFKNLRVLPSGFQVSIVRRGVEVSKHFAGHSVESYMAAIEHRNRLLRKLPAPATVSRRLVA